jgi:predicted dehydrogenase
MASRIASRIFWGGRTVKHLKWGLLAAGNIAGKFAKGLATIRDQATARAVGSRDADKAAKFAADHGIARSYGSYEELLADPDVDAVYISTPNTLHAKWAIKAARAGKHILCEKPVTVNAPELEKVLAVVKECDVFFMEAFMYRCHPQWAKVKEIINAGMVGDVRILNSSFCFNLGLKMENIRLSNPLAGGALMDVGCYCVSFSRLVAGAEPVDAKATAYIGPESRVDQQTSGVLRFPSGCVARFSCATQCATPAVAEIYGSKGKMVVSVPWFPGPENAKLIVTAGGETKTIDVVCEHELYANEALTVAKYLDARQAPAMNWNDSRGQMRTLDLLRASMALRFEGED